RRLPRRCGGQCGVPPDVDDRNDLHGPCVDRVGFNARRQRRYRSSSPLGRLMNQAQPERAPGLLRSMCPYLRHVAGLLTIGSIAGIVMNTAVVLPAVLLGNAINTVVAVDRGTKTVGDLARAALLLVAGALATQVPRVGKRWWLGVARGRIRASVRADAMR